MSDRVCGNKLNIIGVEKYTRKIKLIKLIDLLFNGRVQRLNNEIIRGSIVGRTRLKNQVRVGFNYNRVNNQKKVKLYQRL